MCVQQYGVFIFYLFGVVLVEAQDVFKGTFVFKRNVFPEDVTGYIHNVFDLKLALKTTYLSYLIQIYKYE